MLFGHMLFSLSILFVGHWKVYNKAHTTCLMKKQGSIIQVGKLYQDLGFVMWHMFTDLICCYGEDKLG